MGRVVEIFMKFMKFTRLGKGEEGKQEAEEDGLDMNTGSVIYALRKSPGRNE